MDLYIKTSDLILERLLSGIKQMKHILVTKCSQVPSEPVEDQKQKMDTLVSAATSELIQVKKKKHLLVV